MSISDRKALYRQIHRHRTNISDSQHYNFQLHTSSLGLHECGRFQFCSLLPIRDPFWLFRNSLSCIFLQFKEVILIFQSILWSFGEPLE